MARSVAGLTATATVPGAVTAWAVVKAVAGPGSSPAQAWTTVPRCSQKNVPVVPSGATESRRSAVGAAHRGTG